MPNTIETIGKKMTGTNETISYQQKPKNHDYSRT